MSIPLTKTLTLPDWVPGFVEGWNHPFETPEDRMRLAVALSAQNVEKRTGGPFAAVVYEVKTHRVVAVGVNVVVPQRDSLAHGEIVAIMMAQEALGTHDLGRRDLPEMEMATSAQPCIQCFGAMIWSGIKHVMIGARVEDIQNIVGFDEGPVPPDWKSQWTRRGIDATPDILREEACVVLRAYKASGEPVYNSDGNLGV